MSDSVSNQDVEDVLSSIRRLVSHDLPRTGVRVTENGAEEDVPSSEAQKEAAEKLVLTPSLRVEENMAETVEEDAAPKVTFSSQRHADIEPLQLSDPIEQTQTPAAPDVADSLPADMSEVGEISPSHETLTAKIAALEAAFAKSPDQWEPEAAGLNDYAGTEVESLKWEDHVEEDVAKPSAPENSLDDAPQEAVEETVHQSTSDGADEDLSDFEDTDTIVDEAMLRDLVSSIVREELQGALGERITRNVRKLVRREIHRAISAKELG